MRDPDGQITRRDIFLPIEPDPLFPNGVGLVVKGLHRRASTPEDVGFSDVDSGQFCARLSQLLGVMPFAVLSTLSPAHPEVLTGEERSRYNTGLLPGAGV
eukprot:10562463-Alexandrium_andersonii.AAC.1